MNGAAFFIETTLGPSYRGVLPGEVTRVEIWLDDLPGGLPRKDWSRRVRVIGRRAQFYLTKEIKAFRSAVESVTSRLRPPTPPWSTGDAWITSGAWELELVVFHTRERSTVQEGTPADTPLVDLDSDACLEAARDALEAAEIIDNDVRIRGDRTTTVLRRAGPAMLIRLTRIEDLDAWLADRLPACDTFPEYAQTRTTPTIEDVLEELTT